jgi:beta-lactam-binding protein with PASTA domain
MAISGGNTSGPRKNNVPNIVGDKPAVADPKLTAAEFDKRNSYQHSIK